MIAREKQFALRARVDDAFRLSEEALIVIGGRITARDPRAGHLVATIPWSMKSWGETVTVAVKGSDGNVSIFVRTQSRLATTLIDWGQSADLLQRFGDWVTKDQTA